MAHAHPDRFDVAVIGAGAAGMMCAAVAGQRGARVVLIEHAAKLGEKIRISGGGRCNFTNVDAGRHDRYLSENPQFARSALARYTPADFIALVKRHRIAFHEKHKGQLFCDDSADQIIAMLQAECGAGNVQWRMPCAVQRRAAQRGRIRTRHRCRRAARGRASSSPPEDCRSRRSARPTSATALRASSACASSNRARRWCR